MDKLRSLGEIGLGSRLKRLSEMLMKEVQQIYDEQQIDFDPYLFPAFSSIAELGTTTNSELRENLLISQPAVTQTINKLEKKQLIQLVLDATDKRKKIISLSPAGEELLLKMQPLWRAMDASVKEYTSESAHTMIEHITRFEQAIQHKEFITSIRKRLSS